jgi:uncharacterized protein YndB with AHSA1/START domain
MHVESQITVARSRPEVFDYLAHAEWLPEYVTDFAWVRKRSDGPARLGTEYACKMERGQAEGTFEWTEFERPSRLAWHGPPAKVGPGSMEPSGYWELAEEGASTRVRLVMAPTPRGAFRLLAPFMAFGMRRGNRMALERLKRRLEGGTPTQ